MIAFIQLAAALLALASTSSALVPRSLEARQATCLANGGVCGASVPGQWCCSGACWIWEGQTDGVCVKDWSSPPACRANGDACSMTTGPYCCSGLCSTTNGSNTGVCVASFEPAPSPAPPVATTTTPPAATAAPPPPAAP